MLRRKTLGFVAALLCLSTASQVMALGFTEDLRLWLRSDKGLNLDAGPANTDRVIGWADSLVGDNTVAQDGVGPSGERPLWVDNVINGQPVVRFNAGGREIEGDPILPAGNGARTIITVASSNSTNNTILFDPNGQGPTPNGNVFRLTPETGVRLGNGFADFQQPLTGPAIVGATLPNGGNHSDIRGIFNSATLIVPNANNPGNPVATGTQGYQIGAPSGGSAFFGDVAEVLVFERNLSTAELNQVGFYLQQKYGIAGSFTQTDLANVDESSLSQVTTTLAPNRISQGGLESDTSVFAFVEQELTRLSAPIDFNIAGAGTTQTFNNVVGTLGAGNSVRSHFVSFDSEDMGSVGLDDVSITFESDILGVQISNATLLAGNSILGAPGTQYSNGNVGFENNSDLFTISNDLRTITFNVFVSNNNVDQFRVITQGIPEPTTAILGLMGMAGMLARRRRIA